MNDQFSRKMTTSSAGMCPSDAWFRTTHWSVVLTAARSDTPRAQAALEELCRVYWRPLYIYVRRRGYSPEDAADLTQEFYRLLLERHSLADVRPDKGRFRSFLLAAMNHFLSDAWDKARAKKRGAARVMAVDVSELETQLAGLAGGALTPEQAYERQWALALLDEVYQRLQREHQEQGKAELFAALCPALAGSRETQPYSELARGVGLSEGTVRVTVHRLRQRYRKVLREVIADTVVHPGEVEDEFRYLLRVLSRG
jgi:RNA polymerase sigma-70 factor (ECF subfamily)